MNFPFRIKSGEQVHRKNENGDVENEQRINAEADHLSRELRALRVIIGENAKAIRQLAALLAGLQQRHIERGKPLAGAFQRTAEGVAGLKLLNEPRDGHAQRGARRTAMQNFQRGNQADAGGSDLAQLMEQFGTAGQLPRSDEQ